MFLWLQLFSKYLVIRLLGVVYSYVSGISRLGTWRRCHPSSYFVIGVLGSVVSSHPPRKESGGSILPFAFLPLPALAEQFSSAIRENCAGTSSEITFSVGFRVPTGFTKKYTPTRNYSMWLWRSHLREWNQRGFFWCQRMSMLESSYSPYFLHHARQTSETCYQDSLLAENQHGSFKYLSYILFSNRYMQVFFSALFLEMAALVWNADNERSIASVPTAVLSWAVIKQRKGESVCVVTLWLQKPGNTFIN